LFEKDRGFVINENTVIVIDMNKLKEEGKVKTVSVDSFEQNNLVLVDEGHRGLSGNVWYDYRTRLSAEGFAFEYSATFKQALNANATGSSQQAKEERIAKKRAEGQAKVEAAKRKHQDRINNIQLLKAKSVDECLSIIEQSGKSVFYYYELIEEWFLNNALSDIQKGKVLVLFPNSSTRHNNRKRRYLEALGLASVVTEKACQGCVTVSEI
jgi:hypothetical protein